MKITRIFKKEGGGKIKAHFDVEAEIPSIGIVIIPGFSFVNGERGEFIGFPQKQDRAGKWWDVLKFIDKEDRWRMATKMLPLVQDEFYGNVPPENNGSPGDEPDTPF